MDSSSDKPNALIRNVGSQPFGGKFDKFGGGRGEGRGGGKGFEMREKEKRGGEKSGGNIPVWSEGGSDDAGATRQCLELSYTHLDVYCTLLHCSIVYCTALYPHLDMLH